MTNIEAMKLALDALEVALDILVKCRPFDSSYKELHDKHQAVQTISHAAYEVEQTLCQAIENHSATIENHSQAISEAEQAGQEPVAWICEGKFYEVEQYNRKTELPYPNQTPLYTAPQREVLIEDSNSLGRKSVEWVSLTDDEIAKDWAVDGFYRTPTDFAHAIEAKLKEKNCVY